MPSHDPRVYRNRDGWKRWFVYCPQRCQLPVPVSKEDAEDIAERHVRDTTCHCYDPSSMEYSPTPCENCRSLP